MRYDIVDNNNRAEIPIERSVVRSPIDRERKNQDYRRPVERDYLNGLFCIIVGGCMLKNRLSLASSSINLRSADSILYERT